LTGESLGLSWNTVLNSVYVSGLAAVVSIAAALPIAIMSVRYAGRVSGLLERVTYIGFALPGIVIALALVFFGAQYATPLYQTLVMLVFAYVVLFLPAALGAVRASLLQVSPRVEEAARSLGRSPLGAFTSVTLPAARPGIVAGASLVFLLTMKELPATLILSPTGFTTLSTSVWSFTSEAFFARAAMPALLLIILSGVPLALLMFRERR
jgi:iron(III) transport system permease protein